MLKKYIIFGVDGSLGSVLYLVLSGYRFTLMRVQHQDVDLGNKTSVEAFFQNKFFPSFVINTAAVTAVDDVEINEYHAFEVNALGPKYLAENIVRQGGTLLHVSTDYVFPGTDLALRKETDSVCPVNAYGRTKWAGEVFVRAICPKHFIVRTAWLYGLHGKNFVKTILRKARETGRISVVADQYGSPTFANDLAGAILQLAQTDQYGTYHCTNAGVCSWFELASAAVDIAGIPCEKEAITTEEYRRRFPQSARRPMYSALDNTKIAGVLGKPLRPWRDALEEYVDALQKEEAQDAGN